MSRRRVGSFDFEEVTGPACQILEVGRGIALAGTAFF